ncbi:MAG: hypothetical protein HC912_03065 [Saprospiraceae bacterium]|nr:hypothetical protein [Saprospiraceae bacterium]
MVKVNARRPARGEMEVAHILARAGAEWATPEQAEKVIKTVEEKLNAGESFEELAKTYSQDRATANKGGYLGFFGINRYETAFEDAAFGLEKMGNILVHSSPVQAGTSLSASAKKSCCLMHKKEVAWSKSLEMIAVLSWRIKLWSSGLKKKVNLWKHYNLFGPSETLYPQRS